MTQLLTYLDPLFLVQTLGLVGVWLIIFAESGLFFGFFFPGDSLLFTAGFLASQHYINIWWLVVGAMVAAVLGDNVGYWFGAKVGPKIFTREDSLFFHKDHLRRAAEFFQQHGKKAIILARFVPIVRTFTPILAGVGKMEYKTFFSYNLIGGVLWGGGVTLAGYVLGRTIPGVDRYLWPIILLIVTTSFLPIVWDRLKKVYNK
ncbi:MAG: VTT domain-containing protein [bacterium]|nr:VTT domain-containing protein [bacterium]